MKTQTKETAEEQKHPLPPATQGHGGALATVDDYGDDAGVGMEDVDVAERKIPFVRVLQANSPQCKPQSAGGLPGARPGMLFNVATGELYEASAPPGVEFMPTSRDRNYVEFYPRDDKGGGGGLVSVRTVDDPEVLGLLAKHGRFGKLPTTKGTEFSEVCYLYGVFLPPGAEPFEGVLAFGSTQIKKYQMFVTRYMGIRYKDKAGKTVLPPLWAHRWRLETVFEQKGDLGWWGYRLSLAERTADGREAPAPLSLVPRDSELYARAKAFNEMIRSGRARADVAGDAAAATGGSSPHAEGGGAAEGDDAFGM